MCGIAGLVGRLAEPQREAMRRMNRAMAHRGPDGDNIWESTPDAAGWGTLFGHRRLSILDLSPAASQPMIDPRFRHAVVLNGEIYNYVALREQLAARGEHVQSTGDTAPLLRHLCLDGLAALGRFRGMYALGFLDVDARTLTLARDPLGIKPMYIARNPDPHGEWSLMFASEVRALLASGLLAAPRLDPFAAASVVWNGYVVAPGTAVAGIETLMPGEHRVYDSAGRETHRGRHWSLPAPGSLPPISEEELAEQLRTSVELHLASDVPLGVFLSGGVDSSAVAHLARQTSRTAVQTFTLAFGEREYNEGEIARAVAQAIGSEHRELVLTEDTFLNRLDKALDSLDQPSFDGLNSYFMSHAVRDAGFTVALVGSGGDELFGGYTSFRDLPQMQAWSARTRFVPTGLKVAAAQLVARIKQPGGGSMPPQTRWAKLPDMVARGGSLMDLYQLAYALFLPSYQQQLLAPDLRDQVRDGLSDGLRREVLGEAAGRSPLGAISVMEQRLFLGERLLRDTDATSMSASLETRLPLVDQDLLTAVMRLDDDQRYQPVRSKAMLRRIGLRGLDPALFDRPKSGFELPYDRWLRSRLGATIDRTLRDADAIRATGLEPSAVARLWTAFREGAPGLYWSRVWAIYVYVRWCHRWGVVRA